MGSRIRTPGMRIEKDSIVWCTKWVSSIVIIAGMTATSSNIYPLNMYLHLIGILGWLGVSVVWNDRSLIVLNLTAACIFFVGIIINLF